MALNKVFKSENSGEPGETIIVSKMSLKGMGCRPRGGEEAVVLARVGGKASGILAGEDRTGRMYSALTGQFYGINMETGETFASGKLFLPSGIHEQVEARVKELAEGGVVMFGLEIRCVAAANPVGYTYQAVSILPVAEHDNLSEIREAMAGYKAGFQGRMLVKGSTEKTA
jgi:hypothetical protein